LDGCVSFCEWSYNLTIYKNVWSEEKCELYNKICRRPHKYRWQEQLSCYLTRIKVYLYLKSGNNCAMSLLNRHCYNSSRDMVCVSDSTIAFVFVSDHCWLFSVKYQYFHFFIKILIYSFHHIVCRSIAYLKRGLTPWKHKCWQQLHS
jgi:hypothetical protein